MISSQASTWPRLRYDELKDTCETLQLWTQVVGKVRLAQTPWLNHSWHVTLYVTARGLGSSLIPHAAGAFDIEFDFIDQSLAIRAVTGASEAFDLEPMPVAAFHARFMAALEALSLPVSIHPVPNEMPAAVPFGEDWAARLYDGTQKS